jgi:hypothetical protein
MRTVFVRRAFGLLTAGYNAFTLARPQSLARVAAS